MFSSEDERNRSIYERLCKLYLSQKMQDEIFHMENNLHFLRDEIDDEGRVVEPYRNIGELLDLEALKDLRAKRGEVIKKYLEYLEKTSPDYFTLTRSGIIFEIDKGDSTEGRQEYIGTKIFVEHKDLYKYCITQLKDGEYVLSKLPKSVKPVDFLSLESVYTDPDLDKKSLKYWQDVHKLKEDKDSQNRIKNYMLWYQMLKQDESRILNREQMQKIVNKIEVMEIFPAQPFYELCKLMKSQIKYWEINGILGTLAKPKISPLLVNYASIVYTWYEFIRMFDVTKVYENKSWLDRMSSKPIPDPYFWWGVNDSTKTNLRGMTFQMIKQVYGPMYRLLMILEKKDITEHKKELLDTLKFLPKEIAAYNYSRDFKKMIYILVTLVIYQKDQKRTKFSEDYKEVLKYFEKKNNVTIPPGYDPDPVPGASVISHEKAILTVPLAGRGHITFFRQGSNLNEEFSTNIIEYDIIDDCVNSIYLNPGDAAFLHFLPLLSIIKHWRTIATVYTKIPVGIGLTVNSNTLEPIIKPPVQFHIKTRENTLKDYVLFGIVKDGYPNVHKLIDKLEREVFNDKYHKIQDDKLDEFVKMYVDDKTNLKSWELSVAFKIINRLNFGENMIPNSRNVISYYVEDIEKRLLLCFEYEKEDFTKLKDPINLKGWENRNNYGNFIKNLTEYWSRICAEIHEMENGNGARMLLSQILIYYLNLSNPIYGTANDIKKYGKHFIQNYNGIPVLRNGCPGIFKIGEKYVFGIVKNVVNQKEQRYAIYYIKGNKIGFSKTELLLNVTSRVQTVPGVTICMDDGRVIEDEKLVIKGVELFTPERYKVLKDKTMYDEKKKEIKDIEKYMFEFYDPNQFPLDDPFRYLFFLDRDDTKREQSLNLINVRNF
jgi:hypothetical protein